MRLPSIAATAITAAALPGVVVASTNGLGQALFGWFMIWCGIPALLLGAVGALVAKVGYKISLGALAGLILVVAVIVGSLPAFFLLLLYAAILHVLSFKLTRFVRWLFLQDDAAMYKKYVTDAQQGTPGVGPRPAGPDRG